MFLQTKLLEEQRDGVIVYFHYAAGYDKITIGYYDYILKGAVDGELKPFRSWVNVNGVTVSKASTVTHGMNADFPGSVIHKFQAKEGFLKGKHDYAVVIRQSALRPVVELIRGQRIVAANYLYLEGQGYDKDGLFWNIDPP
jgi:hypothetical protein